MLYGGVAAAAALAGMGAAAWKLRLGAVAEPATEAFWAMRFDSPEGQSLAMASLRGKPLLVNFWATWCPPCVEELPMLDSFYQARRNQYQVLGLAVDQPSAVRQWLQTKPLSFPVAMAGLNGTQLSKSLGNLAGVLPFSVVFSATGELLHRRIGKVTEADLALWGQLV